MSERPNLILAVLLALAAAAAAAVVAGLAALGGCGVAGLAAALVGALSACVVFLDELNRAPVGSLVFALLTLATLCACLRAISALLRGRRLIRRVPLETLDRGPLADLAAAAGAPRLYLSRAWRPTAFCFGLLRPRVVVTSGLLARLAADEQAAAVWHEAFHARGREPLKCALARLAASTFFWIPAFTDLLERSLLAKELAADRVAVANTSRRALAGALAEVAAQRPPAGAVALSEFAACRVDRLFDPCSRLPPLFRPRRLLLSLISAAGLTLLLLFPSQVELASSQHLKETAASASLHGLPGMAIGLTLNALALTGVAAVLRRVKRRRADS